MLKRAPILCSLLCVAALSACGAQPSSHVPGPILGPGGRPAQDVDFFAQTLDGLEWRLADLRGQVVLVWFFTTWCAPCMADAPLLDALTHGDQAIEGFTVVGVSVDLEGATLVVPWRETVGVRFPLVLGDQGMRLGQTPFGPLPAVPAAALIDGQGRFIEGFVGPLPVAYVARRARALVEGAR